MIHASPGRNRPANPARPAIRRRAQRHRSGQPGGAVAIALLGPGDFDFYLRIIVRDITHYRALLQNRPVSRPGVREMQSPVILEVVKDVPALPI